MIKIIFPLIEEHRNSVISKYKNQIVTLLDTPGHVDFSAEMERTLAVLDCTAVASTLIAEFSAANRVAGMNLLFNRIADMFPDAPFFYLSTSPWNVPYFIQACGFKSRSGHRNKPLGDKGFSCI